GRVRGQAGAARLQVRVPDPFRTIQASLRCSDFLTSKVAFLMSPKLLQTRYDYLREVALLVAIGNLDGFGELAFTQRAGDCRSKCARLTRSGLERDQAVNHDADGPSRHDEHGDNDGLTEPRHLVPHR